MGNQGSRITGTGNNQNILSKSLLSIIQRHLKKSIEKYLFQKNDNYSLHGARQRGKTTLMDQILTTFLFSHLIIPAQRNVPRETDITNLYFSSSFADISKPLLMSSNRIRT